jgi:asparagine synthase (glutamine-hydrolysing)
VADVLGARAVEETGVFAAEGVGRLWRKCQASGGDSPLSNADNMALVGVLSTGLLHELLVRRSPARVGGLPFRTFVDRLREPAAGRGGLGREAHPT